MNIRIADICLELQNIDSSLKNRFFHDYLCNNKVGSPINVDNTDFAKIIEEFGEEMPSDVAINLAYHKKIADCLPLHNAFLLHSACFDVDGVGVAFAAHSGTGKTTHMLLWQKLLGDRLKIVNGDKPIIRFFEDDPASPYAYGTPWCGKDGINVNTSAPLAGICFLHRGDTLLRRLTALEALPQFLRQTYGRDTAQDAQLLMSLLDDLLRNIPVFEFFNHAVPGDEQITYQAMREAIGRKEKTL